MTPSTDLNDFKFILLTVLADRFIYDALERPTHDFWDTCTVHLTRQQCLEEGVGEPYVDFFILLQDCKIIGPHADLYDAYHDDQSYLQLNHLKQYDTGQAHVLQFKYHRIKPDPELQYSYLNYFKTLGGVLNCFIRKMFTWMRTPCRRN